ncbi:MAG TPA: SDR family NAD(P)-dependent oxidoreductase [Mycobacterium sp.]|nr:SDR family NAD(P)-dependent oxidoreductase [Micromonosporaceae bacterium]
MNDKSPRVWIITGATSGFGRALTEAVLGRGDIVAGAARTPKRLDDLTAAFPDRLWSLALDVTDTAACVAAVDEVVDRFGHVDVLVNNAGRTQIGALEETTEEELRYLFDLHFFGPAALTGAVLPHMRRAGGGAIVQMSSTGGQISAAGFGAYSATKHALEGLTEALREEVTFGVNFLIVEPGSFRTGLFGPESAYVSTPIADYNATVGRTRAALRMHGSQAGDPAKAAQAILTALDAPEPPLRLALGADAVASIRGKLESMLAELSEWESLSDGTAFDSQP